MSMAIADQEASTAAVTRSCFERFQQCIQKIDGKTKTHVQTRLADLRLWADSVGAVAHDKASLDSRFQHRPDDIIFIRNLLSMLEGFLKDLEAYFVTPSQEPDLRDIMTNVDSTIDTLAFVGVQIRRSGRKSRIRKADTSFDQNQDKYRDLRAHLACVVLSKPTKEGRPKEEGKDINSVEFFAKAKLSPIQERLVEANLRRRHRFQEAQRHSDRLKDRSRGAAPPMIPQQFMTIPTSASGLDSKWGGFQEKRKPGPAATRITSTTAKMRYPRAQKLSNAEQKLAKCPCCCQAIPVTELEGSRWTKHVANDLCPYTCVVPNCPTPYILFVTQDEWNNHVINDHPPHWQCPCCGGDPPIFESLSGITHHLMTVHSDEVEADLEEFLSDAEISIMGITNCPLCDSEGPPDSLDLMEHILQHVHDFSLRSLPWPTDLTIPLQKSINLFDTHHAVKITKDDKGNEYIFDMAEWAEAVNPTFNQSRGVLVCYDSEVSLRLHDLARNQPKGEEESTQQSPSHRDYFSQRGNDYFKDESSDGRFPSQTSHSSQQTQNTVRSSGKHQPIEPAIGSIPWPSRPTRPGWRRRHLTRRSRSGMQAAASASRRSRAIAQRSIPWPSRPTRPGWRRRHLTRRWSRSGMQAAATASRRLRAIAVRSSQWPSPTTRHGWRRGQGTTWSRSGFKFR
ncbi:hypothetical protein GQ44DRAFT_489056 [Phaeosphaeriaceae sp. PMI808]|nr:hypothetical protein GQ44DRAFT_489056 [Phaeosphaeriaceae sp. PMI808]